MEHDMSSQIENELRTAFEAASDFVQPRPGLAERVRRGSRRHTHRMMAGFAAAAACALVAAGGAFAAVHHQSPTLVGGTERSSRVLITLPRGDTALAIVASGAYLYTVAGPPTGPFTLAAYNRLTGKLIRQITFRSGEGAVPTIGPGGSVWLTVWPEIDYRRSRIWLLSPDLRLRSVGPVVPSSDILPVTRTTAVVPVAQGLLELHMPAPGTAGHATEHLEPGTSLGAGVKTTGGLVVSVGGRVVVELTSNSNPNQYYFVVAGHPGTRGDSWSVPVSAAAADGSLWSMTGPLLHGSLVRLNAELKPTTPSFAKTNPALKNITGVWSYGDTVWVSRNSGTNSLACFSASSAGPVVTLPVTGHVVFMAAAARTVYVITAKTATSLPGRTVTSYPVPAACR